MRSKVLVLGAALVAVLMTALPASAGCETSIAACGLDHDDTTATPMHVQQISTTVPLRTDNEGLSFQIYASLIPAQYDIPTVPLVGVSLAQIQTPTGSGAATESWVESTLAIRVANDGVDGWYPISRATTSADRYDAERELGWPSYVGEVDLVAGETSGWVGSVDVDTTRALLMEFQRDGAEPSAELTDWTQQRDPFLSLFPIFNGPTRYRVQNSPKPPAPVFDALGGAPDGAGFPNVTDLPPLDTGQVHLVLDPNLNDLDSASPDELPNLPFSEGRTLGEMIELDQTLPGAFWETDGARFTQTDDLDDGQDGPLPSTGPAPSVRGRIFAPPNAPATGFLPPLIALPQGSSLDLDNRDLAVHDVTSVQYDPETYMPFFYGFASPQSVAEVARIQDLAPGQYEFVCSIHRGQMTGTLVIF